MQEKAKRLGLIACLGGLAGCYEPEVHYESAVIADPVYEITLDVGAGDLSLRGADVSAVTVDARIEGPTNHLAYRLEEGQLTVFDECNEDHCSMDMRVLLPESLPLRVRTGSGDIQVERTLGALLLRTGSGDILGSRVLGAELDAETGSGDVIVDAPGDVGRIRVKTGSGDVDLDVLSGAYQLNVSTGSGDRQVRGIEDVSDAPRSIDVRTGSGDVVIEGH
jgi:DUF4097 and DUF4098 domain-containing protein YvlB